MTFYQGIEMSTTTYYQKIKSFVLVIDHFDGDIRGHPCLLANEIQILTGVILTHSTLNIPPFWQPQTTK